MKWIIDMPKGWYPHMCAICSIECQQPEHAYRADCPLEGAREAKEIASGKVREAQLIEESTYIGDTDISLSFNNGAVVSVYCVEENQ